MLDSSELPKDNIEEEWKKAQLRLAESASSER
jgi:hypothetical protein